MSEMIHRVAAAVGRAGLLISCRANPRPVPAGYVPLQVVDGVPVVPVRLPGSTQTWMLVDGHMVRALLDTGRAHSLVDASVVQRLGLAESVDGPDASGAATTCRADSLRLQGFDLGPVSLEIAAGRLPPAHLLVGTDLLLSYGVILDLAPQPFLVLEPVRADPAEELASRP